MTSRHRRCDRYPAVRAGFLTRSRARRAPRFRRQSMGSAVRSFVERWSRPAVAGCVLFGCVISVVLLAGWGGDGVAASIGAWGTFPIMIVMLVMMWPVITDHALSSRRRTAFKLMFSAGILDAIASIGWGYS